MADATPPLLLFVVGPPAVGKMSVGQAITERTGLRLFHNHIAIELALRYFDYGTPAFHRIDGAIRRLVLGEVAASDLPGLVFTFVWAFNLPEEQEYVDECGRPFRERGARVLFVELEAAQAERLKRAAGGSRLAAKPPRGHHPESQVVGEPWPAVERICWGEGGIAGLNGRSTGRPVVEDAATRAGGRTPGRPCGISPG
jgi:hypothetical protein